MDLAACKTLGHWVYTYGLAPSSEWTGLSGLGCLQDPGSLGGSFILCASHGAVL